MPFHNLKYIVKEPAVVVKIWKIIGPALIQAILVTLANVIDIILIGSLLPGTSQDIINGVSTATVMIAFVIFAITAFSLGGNVYYGQFLKTNNVKKIKEITNFKIVASFLIVLFFVVLFNAIGTTNFIHIILSTPGVASGVAPGAFYMKWLMLMLVPLILTLPCYAAFIATGKAWIPMVFTLIGISIDIILVVLLINPHIGNLGLKGVALATFLSKLIEAGLVILYILKQRPDWSPSFKTGISKWTFKKLTLTSFLILPSEFLYPLFAILEAKILIWTVPVDQIKMFLSISSATSVLGQLAFSLTVGLYSAVPYFISSHLGQNDFKKAEFNSKVVIGASFFLIILISVFIALSSLWWPYLFKKSVFTSSLSIFIGRIGILGTALGFMLYACSVQLFTIVRSGGFQWLVSLCDQGFWFIIYLPIRYLLLKFLYPSLAIWWILFLMDAVVVIILIIASLLYYLLPWKRNLIQSNSKNRSYKTWFKYIKFKKQIHNSSRST